MSTPEDSNEKPLAPPAGSPADASAGGSAIRGTIWSVGGSILPQFYTTLTSIVTARILGADSIGQLTFIAFVTFTLGTALTLGLPNSLARHYASALGEGREGEIRALYRWSWRTAVVSGVIALAVLWGIGLSGSEPRAGWFFAGISGVGIVFHQMPSQVLTGMQRWRETVMPSIITGSVAVVAKIAILLAGSGIVGLLAIDAGVIAANVVITVLLARRALATLHGPALPAPALIRDTKRFAIASSINVLISWVVFRRSEVLFLNHYSTDQQIAIYSIAFSLIATLLWIPTSAAYVLRPAFATFHGAGEKDRISSSFGRSLRIVTPVTIVLTAYSFVIGPGAIRLLYGDAFVESGEILRILLLSFPLVPLMALSTAVLTGIGRQWFLTAATGFAAILNVLLDVVLISRFDAVGAAVANSVAQLAGAVPILIIAVVIVGGVDWGGWVFARVIAVSSVAGLAAAACVVELPLVAGLVVGTVAFALVLIVVARFVPLLERSDAMALVGHLGGRARGVPRSFVLALGGMGGAVAWRRQGRIP
jgi:O-antigen/teichoic acid export membrane protein